MEQLDLSFGLSDLLMKGGYSFRYFTPLEPAIPRQSFGQVDAVPLSDFDVFGPISAFSVKSIVIDLLVY